MQGFPEKAKSKLDDYGFIQSRPKGEIHANNQQMSKLLHKAIGLGGKGKAPQVLPCYCPAACDGGDEGLRWLAACCCLT